MKKRYWTKGCWTVEVRDGGKIVCTSNYLSEPNVIHVIWPGVETTHPSWAPKYLIRMIEEAKAWQGMNV